MGKYENKIAIESCVKTIHEQQCTEHKVQSMIDELEMVYDKAKAWEQFKNDYHTEITQAIDNLFKLNNMDIAGETIFLLEKILSDLENE